VSGFWPCAFAPPENKIQAARIDRDLKDFIEAILENKCVLALSVEQTSKA
jgi:hypothetical protein